MLKPTVKMYCLCYAEILGRLWQAGIFSVNINFYLKYIKFFD